MRNKDVARCRKCGKVIVGSSKLGLCDSCFSKEGTKVGLFGTGAAILYKNRKRIFEFVREFYRKFKL